jgi:hypothetical protein
MQWALLPVISILNLLELEVAYSYGMTKTPLNLKFPACRAKHFSTFSSKLGNFSSSFDAPPWPSSPG